MKNKIKILLLSFTLIIGSVAVVHAANNYEYNDVNIYVNNVLRGTTALRSDTVIPNNTTTYFICDVAQDGYLKLQMATGQPINTGIQINSISTIYAYFLNTQLTCAFVNGNYRVAYTYTDATVYQPINIYLNAGAIKMDTPVLSITGNTISWSPINGATGYNIRYSSDGSQYNTTITNYSNTNYVAPNSGYYTVQAVSNNPQFEASDWANSISITVSASGNDNSSGGILNWLISTFADLTAKVETLWGTLGTFFHSLGDFFSECFAIIPSEISSILISVLTVGLLFGVIKHIL